MKTIFLIYATFLFPILIYGQSSPSDSLVKNNNGWNLDSLTSNTHEFYEELEIFHDKNGTITFEELRKNEQLFGINSTLENYQSDQVYWAKLVLRGSSIKTNNYLFHFTTNEWKYSYFTRYGWEPSWERIDAWLVHEDGKVIHQKTGIALSKEDKSIPSPMSLTRFEIQQNENITLYDSIDKKL